MSGKGSDLHEKVREDIGRLVMPLARPDYLEFLEELEATVEGWLDAYREEEEDE